MRKYYYPEDRIAIVGMGGIFPDADDVRRFWLNLLEKKVSIKKVPDSLINSKVFYRPETFKQIDKQNKTYTLMGALVNHELVMATGSKFKIPPAVAEQMDINQHGAIYCVDQALKALQGKQPAPERTAIIFGNGNPARRYDHTIERTFFDLLEEYLSNNKLLREKLDQAEYNQLLEELAAEALQNNLPITEDTAPGHLQNLVAGRIANVFDFHGPAFTVDAACASSLAAIIAGVQGLRRQEYDLVITGGVDLGFNISSLAAFSALNALSPDGSFPFDTRANGFVIGQGGGVVIMKRLEDALRDHDRIIALFSGYGQGSDGKGKYIAAPNEDGQARVIEEACRMADYPVDTVEMVEAHGTGTTVGDIVEIAGLKKAFFKLGAAKTAYCGVGSVKSNIGHLKSAAGAAAIIKTALALEHKILPPSAGIKQINPKLQLDGSPFYILTDEKKWSEHSDYPRRANISSFGFGGANCHVTMEEFRPEFYRKVYAVPEQARTDAGCHNIPAPTGKKEAVFFAGESIDEINRLFHRFLEEKDQRHFSQKVMLHNAKVSGRQKIRLAILASSQEELREKWGIFERRLKAGQILETEGLSPEGIFFGQNPPVTSAQIALLFPGQASQYPNMGKELPEFFPIIESFYTQADALWEAKYGYAITPLIFGDDQAALEQSLKDTKNTHPAMFLSCAGLYRLLAESGVKGDYLVGHSLGEMTALFAGEMLDLPLALQLIGARGFSFDAIPGERRGKMISIKAGPDQVAKLISEFEAELYIANLNSPEQTVVGGADPAIERLAEKLTAQKIIHTVLNVSHAFHTSFVAEAAAEFHRQIAGMEFSVPRAKVVANHLQKFYPETPKAIKNVASILKEQITSPVRFADSIKMLYEKGVRVFIEVGPSTVLTNLVKQILEGQDDFRTIVTNRRQKDAAETYYQSLAELFALGVAVRPVPSRICLSGATAVTETTVIKNNPLIKSSPEESPARGESLVYSGVSIGLPGSFKKIFADDNFDLLCEGKNFIELLTDDDLRNMLDLNITRLIKSEERTAFKQLSSINDLIRLAGKLGELDMIEDYLVDEQTLQQMTTTICAGVAAGYEALRDAGIPLVREWIPTSSGTGFPGRLLLPAEMRDDTGIIYASCFTKIEPFVREVSKYIAAKFGNSSKQELMEFYNTLILEVKEPETKQYLTDWFTRNYCRLNEHRGEDGVYRFNNDFMAQFSSLANNRLAQFIGASGPNFQLSAACSSTAYAVTVAESLIRSGHAARMIVIGAENSSSKTLLPWIGGGFLTSGAATNEADIYNAAVPFDNRRNGMIIGAGAVGIVIEKESEVEKRGMKGICRLLGTHSFNMAGHQTRIDSKKYSIELERFIAKMERQYQLDRKVIAPRTLYFSHETYTPKKGGCSQTEKIALETVFGADFREILVTNTKGMTGHTIGASIEEAVAAKCLQYQKAPPVVNYKEPDPELEGLKLSRGGSHSFDYILRMVAGFGGQGNYLFMQRLASGEERVIDRSCYESWLEGIAGSKDPVLELKGRILTFKERLEIVNGEQEIAAAASFSPEPVCKNNDEEPIVTEVLKIISEVTKYPMDMLDLDMEMEADLGIDTVKQATIVSYLADKYPGAAGDRPQISALPKIRDLVDLARQTISQKQPRPVEVKNASPAVVNTDMPNQTGLSPEENPSAEVRSNPVPSGLQEDVGVEAAVIGIISEITKYPPEMLEEEMEMEADLGIDTVKQATIFSILGERFGMSDEQNINISEYKTIGAVIAFVKSRSLQRESSITAGDLSKGPTLADSERLITAATESDQGDLSYQIPVAVGTKLPPKDFSIKGKNVWIIGNDEETVAKTASFLAKETVNIETYVFTAPTWPKTMRDWIESRSNQRVEVLIDCGDLGRPLDFSKLTGKAEKDLLALNGEARFEFFKELHSKLSGENMRILCAVSMDGEFGYAKGSTSIINPYSGALCGFYKGLRKEWTQAKVKIVDCNISSKAELTDNLFAKLIKEIEAGGDDYEIGYSGKTRKTIKLDELDQAELKQIDLPPEPHFLITGGANGITAEIALGLAGRIKGRYTLIGRTVLPENITRLAAMDDNQLNRERDGILNRLKKTVPKVTPLMVQMEFEKITKAVSAYRLIEKIKASGSEVLYLPCDVRMEQDLRAAVQEAVKKHGPIHGLIHGAGVEKSRLLPDKSPAEFREVFSVKAEGICNLVGMVDPAPLKIVIGFSSISGRFGNEAQLDYCAANSFLAGYLRKLKTDYPQIHTLSIAWSGWKDLGMAWRNDFVKNHSEEMGINLIEPDRGVRAMINLLTHSLNHHEVVVSKGLKGFINANALQNAVRETPLIDWITVKGKQIEKAYKVISVKRDPLFDHHRLGAVPLVPAVGMMEICAEYHRLKYGPKAHYSFRKLSILNPLKLFHDQSREIFVAAKSESDSETLELTFNSYFQTKLEGTKLVSHAEMSVGGDPGDFQAMLAYSDIISEKLTEIPWRQFNADPKRQFNNNINFGPLFVDEYGKANNTIAFNEDSLVYTYTLPKEQLDNEKYQLEKLLINPCLTDTLFQAAAIHALSRWDRIHLPVYAEEIGVIRVPRQVETLKIIARLTGYQADTGVYDLIMLDVNGEICYFAKKVMVKRINL
jgi:acyl transferase domain-containing protein/NAD(P)-dependent dehydrogenase (short-subunit alcohol dehydrogenase family)